MDTTSGGHVYLGTDDIVDINAVPHPLIIPGSEVNNNSDSIMST